MPSPQRAELQSVVHPSVSTSLPSSQASTPDWTKPSATSRRPAIRQARIVIGHIAVVAIFDPRVNGTVATECDTAIIATGVGINIVSIVACFGSIDGHIAAFSRLADALQADKAQAVGRNGAGLVGLAKRHVPPQSMSVSTPFCIRSSQDASTQAPLTQVRDSQSAFPRQT